MRGRTSRLGLSIWRQIYEYRVAVKELKLSYHIPETISFTCISMFGGFGLERGEWTSTITIKATRRTRMEAWSCWVCHEPPLLARMLSSS